MKIDFYLQPGSQSFCFTPPDYFGRGVGGAEYALIALTTELAQRGHIVTVYNEPETEAIYDGVRYENAWGFDPYEKRDAFVLFRNPFDYPEMTQVVNAKQKFFWSCDQRTAGNYAADIFPFVDKAITISPYHSAYFANIYNANPTTLYALDLGVRLEDYAKPCSKSANRLLYCSVPSRGLKYLATIFPLIRHFFDDAELYITSDFSLWGRGIGAHNDAYKAMFAGMAGVHFLGKVPREELVELQRTSDLLVYPNAPSERAFPELFCVSVAECQVAGCVPVTSAFGGLQTTVIPGYGEFILNTDGDGLHPDEDGYAMLFVERVTRLLQNRKTLRARQSQMAEIAKNRFDWQRIADQWEKLLNNAPPRQVEPRGNLFSALSLS